MRKASRILFLIGAILAIVSFVSLLIAGGFMLYAAGLAGTPDAPQWVTELLAKIAQYFKVAKPEQFVLAFGVFCVVFAALSVPAAVLAFICRGKEKPGLGLVITATAFAVASGSTLCILGGIFGIISTK